MPYVTASDGCRLYYDVKGKADGQALFVTYPWTDALVETAAELGIADDEGTMDSYSKTDSWLGADQ